jgi:hypothetical protein
MSDAHLRLLRRVAAVRRRAVRRGASTADTSGERLDQLTQASARADAQLTAATRRRRRRALPE